MRTSVKHAHNHTYSDDALHAFTGKSLRKNITQNTHRLTPALMKRFHVRIFQEKSDGMHVQFNEDASPEAIFGLYAHLGGKVPLHVGGGRQQSSGVTLGTTVCMDQNNTVCAFTPQALEAIPGNFDDVLLLAIHRGATDLHFNPYETETTVSSRIDGVVSDLGILPGDIWASLRVQMKMRAHLDIAETRRPQSGCFSYHKEGVFLDIRVSTHPCIHGERIVLRFLGMDAREKSLSDLGFSDSRIHAIRMTLKKSQGVFLVTGPTGSGKTTTLYSLVHMLYARGVRSIMTLEDPVEYRRSYMVQSNINPALDFSYAQGLRSLLRQDPEVILLGEIRDEETARMAYRAAMTGTLILATVHAGNIQGVIARLIDFGVGVGDIASQTMGVLNQRLIRTRCVCGHKTCVVCAEGGLRGRTVLDEYVRMPSYCGNGHTLETRHDLMRWLAESQEESILSRVWDLLRDGRTTFAEIERALGPVTTLLQESSHEAVPWH
ncbi:MAG: Flp pilus assembly complex ATPase component TadA [Alphaproteobacteria bacterium]|nr:MAG: Flp pilus assembly complex ATPase component TadA [Alphaproteobacteria bacterium]